MLSVVLVAAIWGIIDSFVEERLEGAEACYKMVDQITLNNDWTCYNVSSNQLQFSIEMKNANLRGILVSVSFGDRSTVFTIKNESTYVTDVSYINQELSAIALPPKESAKTYVLSNVAQKPNEIIIAAISEKKQCDVSDRIDTIHTCD